MSSRTTLVWGVVFVAIGLLGLGIVWVLGSSGVVTVGDGTYSSAGQRIYYTGVDTDGQQIPRAFAGSGMMGPGMMGGTACVECHGTDGRGGRIGMMFGSVEIPDIRYSALTSLHSENGTTAPAWSESDIARAIRDGVEPDGQRLKAPMPRWDMTDAEVKDVIAYLKELDAR